MDSQDVKKKITQVNTDNLLTHRDVLRMAKASVPGISLSHTKARKNPVLQAQRSTNIEFKGKDGRYPVAYFDLRTGEEISQEEVKSRKERKDVKSWETREESVIVYDEILAGPVQEELYAFLYNFVAHLLSQTTDKDSHGFIKGVVVSEDQVKYAINDLNLSSLDKQQACASRSRKSMKTPSGSINMVAFKKMLNLAVDKVIEELAPRMQTQGSKKVIFSAGAVQRIRAKAEARISFLFSVADTYARSGYTGNSVRRVNLQHFEMAQESKPLSWNVQRGMKFE